MFVAINHPDSINNMEIFILLETGGLNHITIKNMMRLTTPLHKLSEKMMGNSIVLHLVDQVSIRI